MNKIKSQFEEKKEIGLISTQKNVDSGEVKVFTKQFDIDTGEEIDSKQDTFLKATLEQNRDELKIKLANIESLIAEFDV